MAILRSGWLAVVFCSRRIDGQLTLQTLPPCCTMWVTLCFAGYRIRSSGER